MDICQLFVGILMQVAESEFNFELCINMWWSNSARKAMNTDLKISQKVGEKIKCKNVVKLHFVTNMKEIIV